MDNFKKEITFTAGHNCLDFECKWDSPSCRPGSGGSHGKHGVDLRFILTGKEGAVIFILFTGWIPGISPTYSTPMPAEIQVHSKTSRSFDESPMKDCLYTQGDCYCRSYGLLADEAMISLVNGGDTEVWNFLQEFYNSFFHNAPNPVPFPYTKHERKFTNEN
jgi:hypothetical protein